MAYGSWSSGAVTTAGGLATRIDGQISGSDDASDFWVNRSGQPAVTVQVGLNARTSIWYDSAQTMPSLVTRVQYPHSTTPGAGGRTVYMSWNPRGNLMETRDSTCRKLASCSPAQVNTTTYIYNDPNQAPDSPTRVTDALSRHTDYVYNTLGILDLVTDTRGHETKFWYKDFGLFKGLVDSVSERQVETWHKDLADTGFVLTDLLTRFAYDANGLVVGTVSPTGVRTSYAIDQYGRTYQAYDPLRARTRYTFDVANRVKAVERDSAPHNHPGGVLPLASCDTLYIICSDPNLNPNQGLGPDLTTHTFHGAVGVDSVKDPRGVFRGYLYDARGNLVRELDAFRNASVATYDQSGLLTQSLGRTNTSFPHQDTVKFTYDGMGRLTKRWFNTSRLPWPFAADSVPGDSTRYTYDQLGRILSAISKRGSIRRTYYPDGSLRTQTAVYPPGIDSASYEYDASGARTAMYRTWTPSSGTGQTDLVTYSYGSTTGDLTSITATWGSPGPGSTTVGFAHDGLGRRHRLEYSGNVKVHFRYDASGILRRQKSVNPQLSSADNLEFVYAADSVDASGRTLRMHWSCDGVATGTACGAGATKTVSSRYDRYGWLVRQKILPSATDSFTYDPSGNRTAWLKAGGNRYYRYSVTPYASNVLVLDSAQSHSNSTKGRISSNANGARVSQFRSPSGGDEIDKFFYYDGLGRTTGARDHSASTSGFIDCNWYDPDGRMFVSCDALGSHRQVFDGDNVAALVDKRWVFVTGPGIDDPLVALYRPSTGVITSHLYYFVTDGAGRQQAVARADGSFGEADADYYEGHGGKYAGGTSNAQSFQASRMESPTPAPGISYFRNRAYDQATGRWLQEDPIGVAGGINLYQFNGNNPVNYSDPFGLNPILAGAAAVRMACSTPVGARACGAAAARAGQVIARSPGAQRALQRAKELGDAGEKAVGHALGLAKNTLQRFGNRIPDFVDDAGNFIAEVKNVRYQANTQQLREMFNAASAQGKEIILYVRDPNSISGPLAAALKRLGGRVEPIP